jgi:hypothetical protein
MIVCVDTGREVVRARDLVEQAQEELEQAGAITQEELIELLALAAGRMDDLTSAVAAHRAACQCSAVVN